MATGHVLANVMFTYDTSTGLKCTCAGGLSYHISAKTVRGMCPRWHSGTRKLRNTGSQLGPQLQHRDCPVISRAVAADPQRNKYLLLHTTETLLWFVMWQLLTGTQGYIYLCTPPQKKLIIISVQIRLGSKHLTNIASYNSHNKSGRWGLFFLLYR